LDADPIPLNGLLDLSGEQTNLAITISASATGEITVSGSSVSDGTYIGVTGIIGSGGDDLFIGPSASATWNVTGQDSGQLSFGAIQIDFSGIENLQGSDSFDDTFVVAPEGNLSGSVEGGAGGNDSLTYSPDKTFQVNGVEVVVETAIDVSSNGVVDLSGQTGDLTITVTAPGEVTVTGYSEGDRSYIGVSSIIGGAGTDTLVGPDEAASWAVSGAGSGQLLFGAGSVTIDFSGIESLQGGAGADAFSVESTGSLSGTIDGGSGIDTLVVNGNQPIISAGFESTLRYPANGVLDLSSELAGQSIMITVTGDGTVTVTGSSSSDGDYAGVASVVGSSGDDLLVGPAAGATWSVTGPNSGELSYAGAALRFSGIENLQGADDADDHFQFSRRGNLSGAIDGGLNGADTLVIDGGQTVASDDVEVATDPTGTTIAVNGVLDLSAETDDLVFTVTAAGTVVVQRVDDSKTTYTGVTSVIGGAGTDVLVGPDAGAAWSVTGADAGQVEFDGGAAILGFVGIEDLKGADNADDTFTFAVGGSLSGTVTGGAGGMDTLVVDDGQTVATAGVEIVPLPDGVIALDGVLDLSAESTDLSFEVLAAGVVAVTGSLSQDGVYSGVTGIVGGSGNDTLTGPVRDAAWDVTGPNAGQLTFDAATLDFSGIEKRHRHAERDG